MPMPMPVPMFSTGPCCGVVAVVLPTTTTCILKALNISNLFNVIFLGVLCVQCEGFPENSFLPYPGLLFLLNTLYSDINGTFICSTTQAWATYFKLGGYWVFVVLT